MVRNSDQSEKLKFFFGWYLGQRLNENRLEQHASEMACKHPVTLYVA